MLYRGHSRTSLPILIYIYIYIYICTYISIYISIYIYMYIYIICYPFLMSHEMADHFDPRRFFQQCWGRGLPTKKRRGYIYIYIYIYRVAIFIYSLTILTSPSSYEAGRPPPRGRPESLRVMTGRPPPRGRSEGPPPRGRGATLWRPPY